MKGRTKEQVYEEIKKIAGEKSAVEIGKQLSISDVTVYSIVRLFKDDELEKRIRLVSAKRRAMVNFKNGQIALYEKLRKEINSGKIICSNCFSNKNVEIHHKDKLHYNDAWEYWKADNFNNNPDNIIFLCNSCHQKLHYRELGRKGKAGGKKKC